MFSAAAGHSTIGIPKSVGTKFVKDSVGMKVGKLPKFKKPKMPKPPGTPGAQPFGSLSPGGVNSDMPSAPPLPGDGEMM